MSWIVGDIHGCAFELNELLRQIPADETLVFLGDYVDRGPDSSAVIARLIRESERSVFLMGNHEDMLLDHMRPDREAAMGTWLHPLNGGRATLESYGLDERAVLADLPPGHAEFLRSLRLSYEEETFIAVHAGIRVGASTNLAEQDREDLLWIRQEWLNARDTYSGKTIYYGHTPSRHVVGLGNEASPIPGLHSLGIDTGCVYGGFLTAANTVTGDLLQVRAQRAYSR